MTLGNVWLRKRKGSLRYGLFVVLVAIQPIVFDGRAVAISANVTQLVFSTPSQTTNQDVPASFTVELRSSGGQSESLDQTGATLSLSTTSLTGQFAENDNSPWALTPTYDYSVGATAKSFLYKDTTAGSFTITAKVTGGGLKADVEASQTVAVAGLNAPVGGMPNGVYQNRNSADFSWSKVANATGYEVRMAQNASTLGSASPISVITNSLQQDNLSEGQWYWQVRALNGGNAGTWGDVWSVVIDTHVPVISTSIQDRQMVSGLQSLDMSVGEELYPNAYDIQVKATDGTVVAEGSRNNDSSANFTFTWDTTQVANGTYTIVFNAVDAAQNEAMPLQREVTVVNTPPPPQVLAPTMTIVGSDGVSVNGLVSAVDATFTVRIDGIARPDVVPTTDGQLQNDMYIWTFVLPKDVQDGYSHQISMTAHLNGQDSEVQQLTMTTNDTSAIVRINDDPLLKQLSASLSQPFTLPSSISSVAPVPILTAPEMQSNQKVSDIHASPSNNQSDVFVATPTESGWKLFGVLWYWWGLALLIIFIGGYVTQRFGYPYSTLDT